VKTFIELRNKQMEIRDHIIIIGFGYHGKNVSETCTRYGLPFLVIEMDSEIVLRTSTLNDPVNLGDTSFDNALKKANIIEAKSLILAISNINKIRSIIKIAHKYNPNIVIQIRKDIYRKYQKSERDKMTFCTAVNCIDGRVQLPVINYLKERFSVNHVDMITEPGPNLIIAELTASMIVGSIITRIDLSIKKHSSRGIAIVGHHDCAGNPSREEEQLSHIQESLIFLKKRFPNVEIIGLWVDQNWQVIEIDNTNRRKSNKWKDKIFN
jgi:voltage-gated potassium channel Kch